MLCLFAKSSQVAAWASRETLIGQFDEVVVVHPANNAATKTTGIILFIQTKLESKYLLKYI